MSWWQFWKKDLSDAAPVAIDPAPERRLVELRRRYRDARFDADQGELAAAEDNSWIERIALLTAALATVEADRQTLDRLSPMSAFPLPATPFDEVVVRNDELVEISVAIGGSRFHFREEPDWDERGGPTVRGDLRRQSGDATGLLPPDLPAERHDALLRHLDDSLDVFATDLRDRVLAGIPLPERPALADLARPCATCGGWQDWHGRCPDCTRRDRRRQDLRRESERLERARAAEAEEQHRLVERLPGARRRLALIEAELATLTG